MADEHDQQDRTEQPTQRRLQQARERGEVPRSRDLAGALVSVLVLLALALVTRPFEYGLQRLLALGLDYAPGEAMREGAMQDALLLGALLGLLVIAVPLLVSAVAAIVGNIALGGWAFSSEALAPKPERLNPLSGLKRIFSLRGLVELGKALAKFLVIAMIAWVLLARLLPVFGSLALEASRSGIVHALWLIVWSGVALAAGLILIAAIDVPWQLFDFHKRMRMTREEVKRDTRETEGNPEIRGKIRQLQQQMAKGRMMAEVPKADVVVTNPTHYAVAIRYDEARMRAPIVVAKGVDLVALEIRRVAQQAGVVAVEAPPLARALHRHVDIGKPIPSALYVAVAQVLAYVFRLRAAMRDGTPAPPVPVPEVDPALLAPRGRR